jgi:hypothetical protein
MVNPPQNESVVKGWFRLVSNLARSDLWKILHDRARSWVEPDGLRFLSEQLTGRIDLQAPILGVADAQLPASPHQPSTPCPTPSLHGGGDGGGDGVPIQGSGVSGIALTSRTGGRRGSVATPSGAAPLRPPTGNGRGQEEYQEAMSRAGEAVARRAQDPAAVKAPAETELPWEK